MPSAGLTALVLLCKILADAANLEEALEAEELEEIDLNELLASYVANCGGAHAMAEFEYHGSPAPAQRIGVRFSYRANARQVDR